MTPVKNPFLGEIILSTDTEISTYLSLKFSFAKSKKLKKFMWILKN